MNRPRRSAPHGGMTGIDPVETADNYRRFARLEAAGRSPGYEELALAVAEDEVILAYLAALPPIKRQPNLLFAVARSLLGQPARPDTLHELVTTREDDLRQMMLTRRTQTNEAARCALLLPALTAINGPLALLEVGASAGLTLLPDMYSYDYDGRRVTGLDPAGPLLSCRPAGPVPIPTEVPRVTWRAGIDLNPLDVESEEDVNWLSCLLWPGETDRVERLAEAVAVARRCPVPIHRGDLLDDLSAVAAGAPRDATLVVYHSAVLAYVDDDKRRRFAEAVAELGAVWLSNEGARVLSCIGVERDDPGTFLLVRNGSEILARTDGHAAWIEWLGPERP